MYTAGHHHAECRLQETSFARKLFQFPNQNTQKDTRHTRRRTRTQGKGGKKTPTKAPNSDFTKEILNGEVKALHPLPVSAGRHQPGERRVKFGSASPTRTCTRADRIPVGITVLWDGALIQRTFDQTGLPFLGTAPSFNELSTKLGLPFLGTVPSVNDRSTKLKVA